MPDNEEKAVDLKLDLHKMFTGAQELYEKNPIFGDEVDQRASAIVHWFEDHDPGRKLTEDERQLMIRSIAFTLLMNMVLNGYGEGEFDIDFNADDAHAAGVVDL